MLLLSWLKHSSVNTRGGERLAATLACTAEATYRRHIRTIFRFCVWRTGSSYDGEDAATEVFVKFLDGKAAAVPSERLIGWLLKVADNECKMMLRQRRRRGEVGLEPGREASAGVDPWVSMDLRRAMERLKARPRRAVFLKAVEGLTFYEIAKSLGVTEGAAKMMFYRAIKVLNRYLSDGGSDDG
jgi:RNA polymerase sigma factor (sigma-70 family)